MDNRILSVIEKKSHYIKGFKNLLYVFAICFIIGMDQMLVILVPFYRSKMWLFSFA